MELTVSTVGKNKNKKIMKKLIIIFLLLSSVANAQEQTTVANMQEIQNEIYDERVSVYLHPLIFLGGISLSDDNLYLLVIHNC